MQSRTEEFTVDLETRETERKRPRTFELYEEYRQRSIAEIVRTCKERYAKAETESKGKLKAEVEEEVEDFRIWLEEKKKFDPVSAHYYSISIKTLLLGIETGVQVALLFDMIMDKRLATSYGGPIESSDVKC